MKKRFIRKEIRRRIPKPTNFVRIPAIMGDGSGNVKVAGKSGYVYVRFLSGQIWPVYNGGAAPGVEGTPVWIGTSENMPSRMHVLDLRDVYGDPEEGGAEFDPESLRWPNRNTLWVYGEQFLPGLAMPASDSMEITFLPWKVVIDGAIVQIRGQVVDFSSYVPASGAKWLLVEYDSSGTLSVVESSAVASRSLLRIADIPSPSAGATYFWALRVYETQVKFAWRPAKNDLVDLRWAGSLTGASALPYTPVDLTDWDYLADPGDVGDALDQLADRVKSIELIPDPDASGVTYTPADLADWDCVLDPGQVDDGLDQLAARLTDLEAIPPGSADASTVTYTPVDLADWDCVLDPGEVQGALDQLAARMTDQEAVPPGVSDHGALTGLSDDDHSQYLLKTGLREWDTQGSTPSTPASTKWLLFFKNNGLYSLDSAGNLYGPFGWLMANSVSDTATGTENDYSPSGFASDIQMIEVTPAGAPATLTGLVGGSAGRLLGLKNASLAYTLTLADEDAGSTDTRRFSLLGQDYVLEPQEVVYLVYLYNRWQIIGSFTPKEDTTDPAMDGTAAPGSAATVSRSDHVHPTDTGRMDATADYSTISGNDATTDVTGAELETLTDGSNADGLHVHAGWDGDIADINLDGGTDIGADLADADLILVDDGAGGTNRKSALSRLWTYIQGKQVSNFFSFGTETDVTISGGTLTITNSNVRADTEGGAGTDDLDTISGGSRGDVLILGTVNSTRDVTVKHGTGNILLKGSADATLLTNSYKLGLQRGSTNWIELFRNF